ncbi:MAG: beta-propeller fold lactonase family protein [Gammaproteobacteria bacterium]|nr:beta-propeller fold lactonase family protein [Gammaproteobacteria bacterium]
MKIITRSFTKMKNRVSGFTPGCRLLFLGLALTVFSLFSTVHAESYTLFESGQVRPIVLSEDGGTLYALNTPDNRLEIFEVDYKKLKHKGSVRVGIEPVAVAVRNDDEVWVVNHLSDSVSIVDVSDKERPRVTRTLNVGDEPRDIVFAGTENIRAFITTAHRGQNSPVDPQLTTPGVGRADVWVFDAKTASRSTKAKYETIITVFTDTPRALAVSPDGKKVYVAGFNTGNQTTVIFDTTVSMNGGLPNAVVNADMNGDGFAEPHELNTAGEIQPSTSLIVKFDGQHWVDDKGRIWDDHVKFNLPDKDVFVIDATQSPPRQINGELGYYAGVGSTLFNMAVNPVSGKVYVSNLEARNQIRFEGPGGGGSTVQGHNVESRITVLDSGVTPIHLNKHIDRSACCKSIPNDENARSVAFPMDMAVSRDGKQLFVAGYGSNKIAIYDTEKLEKNSFEPSLADQVVLTGGGPAGIVVDKNARFGFVLTRFDDGISVIDLRERKELSHITMYSPEPASITEGRRFLYDASLTSGSGDQACAGCHVFGDFDSIAWDLGNPDGSDVHNPGPLKIDHADFGLPLDPNFKPMKGPMSTQSLRGLANHGPMHWRGDRHGGGPGIVNEQPDGGSFSEDAAYKAFNGAFVGLIGRSEPLTNAQMQAFTDFALQITYPPNPIRALDNSLSTAQEAGRQFFFDETKIADSVFHCGGCHVVDREANKAFGVSKPGFFGTDGSYTFAFQPQFYKVPQLRNLYQKVGKFGMSNSGYFLADDPFSGNPFFNPNQHMGDQIRGFGFMHDGSVDTTFRFHNIVGFLPRPAGTVTPLDPGNPESLPISPEGMQIRRNLEQFLFVFDSNLFPIVGQQVTLTGNDSDSAKSRVALMQQRADLGECDLIATSGSRGYFYVGGGEFISSSQFDGTLAAADLMQNAERRALTYTCAVPGNGVRIALDRDEDGFFDGVEMRSGSDPADPNSTPAI